jgi:hypothetical protein
MKKMVAIMSKSDILTATRSKAFFVGKNKNRSVTQFNSSNSFYALLGFCLTDENALSPSQSETSSAQRLFSFVPAFFATHFPTNQFSPTQAAGER